MNTGEVHDRSLKVYPNPASEKLWVEIPEPGLKDLVVTDITGRILLIRQLTTENLIGLDLSAFSKGIYLVTLGNEQTRYRARFIVR